MSGIDEELYKKSLKITGIGNEETRADYYKSLEDFENKIKTDPIANPDCLIAYNFAHEEFENFKGPKIFSTYEPFFSMSEKTRKNIDINSDDDKFFLYNNPNIDRRWFYFWGNIDPAEVVKNLKKHLYDERPKLCSFFASFTYIREIPNDLVKYRLLFSEAMGNDIDIYGTKWDLCDSSSLKNRWKGYIQNKHEALKSYNFNLCFENSEYNGYITEKIHNAMMAGCVPLYWGGGDLLKETIPKSCYIDCKNRGPFEIYDIIKNMKKDEIIKYKLEAIKYYESELSSLFSRQRYIKHVIQRILSQFGILQCQL